MTGTSAMTRDDGNVSPYLLRRLRSLQEALRERAKRPRPEERPKTPERGSDPEEKAGNDA